MKVTVLLKNLLNSWFDEIFPQYTVLWSCVDLIQAFLVNYFEPITLPYKAAFWIFNIILHDHWERCIGSVNPAGIISSQSWFFFFVKSLSWLKVCKSKLHRFPENNRQFDGNFNGRVLQRFLIWRKKPGAALKISQKQSIYFIVGNFHCTNFAEFSSCNT